MSLYAELHDDAFAYDEYLREDELYQEYIDDLELLAAQAQQQQDENDEFWSEEEPTFYLEEGWNSSTSNDEPIILTEDEVKELYCDPLGSETIYDLYDCDGAKVTVRVPSFNYGLIVKTYSIRDYMNKHGRELYELRFGRKYPE